MKKITLAGILLIGVTFSNYAQTNRINHYSHSGSSTTLSIFAAADNMGCGEALRGEYIPDTTAKPIKIIKEVDSTKVGLKNTIEIPKAKAPRKGMALDQKANLRLVRKK